MANASTAWNTVGFFVMNFRYGSVYVSAAIVLGTWHFEDWEKQVGGVSRDSMVEDTGPGREGAVVLDISVLRIKSDLIIGRRKY